MKVWRQSGFSGSACCHVRLTALCLLIMLVMSCSPGSVKQYVRPDIDKAALKTIAVLPFNNYTADKHAGEKIRSKINIELLLRGINIVEPGEIVQVLKELRIRSMESLRTEDIINIGNILTADAVITGSVEEFGISKGVAVSYPEVSVHLMMFEASSGDNVWSIGHTGGGASFWTRHFGAEGSTLNNVSERVIQEAFEAFY